MFTRDKDRRQKILDFIRQYVAEHGFPPSVREICPAVDIRSTRAVKRHLDILVEQGILERTTGKARSLRTASQPYALPLVGRIAAGSPILAIENVESHISLSRFESCFLLRVKGDSMAGAGILDKDLVIVRQQSTADNGDIVVALIGDEATVKRFQSENGRIILKPENPEFKPLMVEKDQEFQVIGVVIGLLRNYR